MKTSNLENKKLGLLLTAILSISMFSATASGDVPKNPHVNSIKIQYLAKPLIQAIASNSKHVLGKNM